MGVLLFKQIKMVPFVKQAVNKALKQGRANARRLAWR